MNIIQKFITVSALALGIVLPVSSMAQTAMDHSKMDMSRPAVIHGGLCHAADRQANAHGQGGNGGDFLNNVHGYPRG